jgi:hypothetical protein
MWCSTMTAQVGTWGNHHVFSERCHYVERIKSTIKTPLRRVGHQLKMWTGNIPHAKSQRVLIKPAALTCYYCNKVQELMSLRNETGYQTIHSLSAHSQYFNKVQMPLKHNQQDATLHNGIYYYKCPTCFRHFLRPSSGAQKCIYRVAEKSPYNDNYATIIWFESRTLGYMSSGSVCAPWCWTHKRMRLHVLCDIRRSMLE